MSKKSIVKIDGYIINLDNVLAMTMEKTNKHHSLFIISAAGYVVGENDNGIRLPKQNYPSIDAFWAWYQNQAVMTFEETEVATLAAWDETLGEESQVS